MSAAPPPLTFGELREEARALGADLRDILDTASNARGRIERVRDGVSAMLPTEAPSWPDLMAHILRKGAP